MFYEYISKKQHCWVKFQKIRLSGNLLPKNMFFCVDGSPLDCPPTVPP